MKHTYTYDHYYLYDEIVKIVEKYLKEYPEYVAKETLAYTDQKREIMAVVVTDTKTGPASEKPAYFMNANIHAGEVTGSMSAMYLLDTLLSNLDDEEIQDILAHYAFYVVPRISPDGSEHYLTTPDYVRSIDKLYPYDEPQPGLQPKDLDGDGVVRKMRVKSPHGIWKKSPLDDRLMVRRMPDDVKGDFYHVYQEGEILDYDDVTVTNAPGLYGNDFNRNFPVSWKLEQQGAGKYPLAHTETRAMADFVISHPNIGETLSMHTMGGVFLYPPGIRPAKEADPEDMMRYRKFGEMATEESGFPALNIKDQYCGPDEDVFGSMDDFMYFAQGLVSFTIECWDLEHRAGIETEWPGDPLKETDDKQAEDALKYLKFIDENLDGEGFKPWQKYQHPQLGEVEIGGMDYKYVVQNPPIKFLTEELDKHTRFILREVKALPRVSFNHIKAEKVDEKTYVIEARLLNEAYLPTYITKEALKTKKADSIKVALNGDVTFIEGKQEQDIGQLAGFSCIRGYNGLMGASSSIQDPCEKKIRWVIQSEHPQTITLTAKSNKIGIVKTTVTLP